MNQPNEPGDTELAEKARRVFAESVSGLDAETRSRLAQARAGAVEASASRGFWSTPSRLIPLGAVAAGVLAVALVWQGPVADVGDVEATVLSDLDLLLEGESLDLFEELEFYTWLLEQPDLLESEDSVDGSGV